MDVLYITVPAYNEAQNIGQFVEDWYPVVERHDAQGSSRLVIVDDGSTDDTYHLLKEQEASHPLLVALTKPNGGHGPAVTYGYRYALDHGADLIFQTDSDGQTNPAEFEGFWDLRHDYDAILGNRSSREDGTARVFVEKTLLLILRLAFGVRMPDSNAPFRLMRADLVRTYLRKLPADFNLPNVMLSTYFVYFGERVRFEEISFRPRQGGTNSIRLRNIVRIGWKALGDFYQLRRHIDDEDASWA